MKSLYQFISNWQKSLKLSLSIFILITTSNLLIGQVVINEIIAPNTVELKNLGNSSVNVSNYWLCDFPAYDRLGNPNEVTLLCGNLLIPPGEILTVETFNFSSNDGEMGLYTSSAFSNSSAMVDYVEWGNSGHVRSSVAISAGIWSPNSAVQAFGSSESLAYSGSGDGVDSWSVLSTPNPCAENSVEECDVIVGDITLEDGSTSTTICVDGVPDPLVVTTSGGTVGVNTGWIITDASGLILALPASGPFDLDGAGEGICQIWYIRYEDGLTGLAEGNNLSDLEGCIAISNPILVNREAPDGGTVSLVGGGTEYANCAGDITFEVEHETTAPNLSYWYIITDADDNILTWQNSNIGGELDLSGAPAGECHVWGWNYRGLPDPIVGEHISSLSDDFCEDISDNWVTVIRVDEGSGLGVVGCTDLLAVNYCESALCDDDSCLYAGCTNSLASNYDMFADLDDGSCELVYGCTYESASNYNPMAQIDDGSCVLSESCFGDANGDGLITATDLTQFLTVFGLSCN